MQRDEAAAIELRSLRADVFTHDVIPKIFPLLSGIMPCQSAVVILYRSMDGFLTATGDMEVPNGKHAMQDLGDVHILLRSERVHAGTNPTRQILLAKRGGLHRMRGPCAVNGLEHCVMMSSYMTAAQTGVDACRKRIDG